MWWAGMRGVASVALALAIPLKTDDGRPFPGRDEIIFIAFAVIMTHPGHPGAHPALAGARLGVRADTDAERELEHSLAIRAAKAARRRLREIEEVEDLPEDLSERLRAPRSTSGRGSARLVVDDERREGFAKRRTGSRPSSASSGR